MTPKDKIEKSIEKILSAGDAPTTRSVAEFLAKTYKINPSTREIVPIVRKWKATHLRKIERVKTSYLKLDATQRRAFRRQVLTETTK